MDHGRKGRKNEDEKWHRMGKEVNSRRQGWGKTPYHHSGGEGSGESSLPQDKKERGLRTGGDLDWNSRNSGEWDFENGLKGIQHHVIGKG